LKPTIVHLAGRDDARGLVVHDGDTPRGVSPGELANMFEAAAAPVRVVVLHAGFSERHADALLAHVDCVVGMPGAVVDDAARRFAVGFYEALGDRASVQVAYDMACVAMRPPRSRPGANPGLGTRDIVLERAGPQLRVRPGVDASTLILTASEA
jgi:hypothetical protein